MPFWEKCGSQETMSDVDIDAEYRVYEHCIAVAANQLWRLVGDLVVTDIKQPLSMQSEIINISPDFRTGTP